jgi:hypothetical protein
MPTSSLPFLQVDRALAALLMSERVAQPVAQQALEAALRVLLDAGADVEYRWEQLASAAQPASVPLLTAIRASSPLATTALLQAGADPFRALTADGGNALHVAVRCVAYISRVQTEPGKLANSGLMSLGMLSIGGSLDSAIAATEACVDVLLATKQASELLAGRNAHGMTAAFLAAVLDLPAVLRKLAAATVGATDAWVAAGAAPAPPGVRLAMEPAPALQPVTAGMRAVDQVLAIAKPGHWTAAHEAARVGALSSLAVLLGTERRTLKATDHQSGIVSTARLRDALVGAIRGGRVGAARLILDVQVARRGPCKDGRQEGCPGGLKNPLACVARGCTGLRTARGGAGSGAGAVQGVHLQPTAAASGYEPGGAQLRHGPPGVSAGHGPRPVCLTQCSTDGDIGTMPQCSLA